MLLCCDDAAESGEGSARGNKWRLSLRFGIVPIRPTKRQPACARREPLTKPFAHCLDRLPLLSSDHRYRYSPFDPVSSYMWATGSMSAPLAVTNTKAEKLARF